MAYKNRKKDNTGKIIWQSNWYASVWVYDPKYQRKLKFQEGGYKTKRAALSRESEMVREIEEGRYLPPEVRRQQTEHAEAPALTIEEFQKQYIHHMESKTVRNLPISHGTIQEKKSIIRNHLLPAFPQPMDKISVMEIETYSDNLVKEGKAISTITNILGELRVILKLAKKWGVIKSVPEFDVPGKSPPDKDKFLTPEEAANLVESSEPKIKGLVLFLLSCGARFGEAIVARWGDINFEQGYFHIRRTLSRGTEKHTKSGEFRKVPLDDNILSFLSALRATSPENAETDYIFHDKSGGTFTYSELRGPLKRAVKAAGIDKPVTFSWLRHSYASHLAMMGVSGKYIQDFCGHSDYRITMNRYAHLGDEMKREQVAVIGNIYQKK
ncbi:site-specific integrase [Myxococcota bacterium]|nr:site-specific integrase [Myxococcota bacterium]MBU1534611.1 site-specific integrase [Myxococcota bacterium]